jgi:cell division protein FtsQ
MLNAFNTTLPGDVRLMNATAALLLGIAACLLAGLALMWMARQPVFTLRAIRIDGDLQRNNAAGIRAHASQQLVGNFFSLDLQAGRQSFESVPWVRQAVLSRVWPNRLVVRLEEHRPVALWGREGAGDRLVNSHGEVFEANLGDVEDEDLPTLIGPEGASADMLAMLRRLQPVLEQMRAQVNALSLSGRGSWRVELDTGAELELGRGSEDEIVERTRRFVSTVQPLLARYGSPLQSADLRHNEGYALRLRGVSTTAGPAPTAPRK